MTLPELLDTFRRRAVEAASIGATAPVAAIYEAILADLVPLCPNGAGKAPGPKATEQLLTAHEAAERLHVTPRWLYRHAPTLPFARRLGAKTLRFDADGVAKWLAKA